MSTATEQADALFMRAALSEDNLGYPKRAAFVADDVEGFYAVVVENMCEGIPTVLVNAMGGERLLFPVKRTGVAAPVLNLLDRRLKRIPVVSFSRGAVADASYDSVGTYSTVRAGNRGGFHLHRSQAHVHA
jgi:hypothetical protein